VISASIHKDWTGHSRRPALADHQNDCHLATAGWFKVESIIGDLPKHEAIATETTEIPTHVLAEAKLPDVHLDAVKAGLQAV
jgi:hypothetical protein